MSDTPQRSEPRQEIHALRAAAVLLVIAYHFWPGQARAGFIGVDVFFVISGFLITDHVVRELRATGTVSFARFYARRARRILPAALTVLAACAVATVALSSAAFWSDQLRHITASALFVENWALAADSVDYLAASDAPTPVQHFWSLSVEEQFYLVWPGLLAIVYGLSVRLRPTRRIAALAVALGLVVGLSFAYSLALSLTEPVPAFFNTGARAWEFGTGGLLACLGVATSARRAVRRTAAGIGWTLIVGSAFVFDHSLAILGLVTALPVVGAALVIWAGDPSQSWLFRRAIPGAVLRGLAELSFAAYLWHWPILVFAHQLAGESLSHALRLLLVVLTFALAWATNLLIERPVRFGPLARRRPALTAALAAALTLAVVAPTAGGLVLFERSVAAAAAVPVAVVPGLCVGAEARDPDSDCKDGPYAVLVPSPLVEPDGVSVLHGMGCAVRYTDPGTKSCVFGDPQSDISVALVGDSHAMKMWPAIKRLAEENGWRLVTFLRGACMYSLAVADTQECDDWRKDVAERLAEEGPWDLVFTATALDVGANPEPAVAGLHAAWTPLTDAGAQVIVIEDNPRLPAPAKRCVVDHMDDVSVCDVPRADVRLSDIQVRAAQDQTGVLVVDLTPFYCDDTTCVVSAGGVLLYMDSAHINDEYTVTLAPYIAAQVAEVAPQLFGAHH